MICNEPSQGSPEEVAVAKTMKAAVVRAFGKPLTIEEVAIATPAAAQVLVKVLASGVCRWSS